MEASGHARWFERLVAELQFELWIADTAEVRTKRVRKQKTDRQDAQLILRLLLEDGFPRGSGYRAGKTGICGNCDCERVLAWHSPRDRNGAPRSAVLRSVREQALTAPTLSSRWEKSGRGGTEDETVKLLDGIQRV
jgi:transposase